MTEADTSGQLILPKSLYDQIISHLATWLPLEGCGLLGGLEMDRGKGSTFYPGTNIDGSPTRFTMDPAEVIRAMKQMREGGEELLAIVHSHPRSPAVPSPTDLAEAFYPDSHLVIVSFATTPPDLLAWRLEGSDFIPATVEIVS